MVGILPGPTGGVCPICELGIILKIKIMIVMFRLMHYAGYRIVKKAYLTRFTSLYDTDYRIRNLNIPLVRRVLWSYLIIVSPAPFNRHSNVVLRLLLNISCWRRGPLGVRRYHDLINFRLLVDDTPDQLVNF